MSRIDLMRMVTLHAVQPSDHVACNGFFSIGHTCVQRDSGVEEIIVFSTVRIALRKRVNVHDLSNLCTVLCSFGHLFNRILVHRKWSGCVNTLSFSLREYEIEIVM